MTRVFLHLEFRLSCCITDLLNSSLTKLSMYILTHCHFISSDPFVGHPFISLVSLYGDFIDSTVEICKELMLCAMSEVIAFVPKIREKTKVSIMCATVLRRSTTTVQSSHELL